jgi:putative hydrolase of the HAD superfamily
MTSPSAALFDLYGTLADVTIDEHSRLVWQGLADWLRHRFGHDADPSKLHDSFFEILANQVQVSGEGFALTQALTQLLGPIASEQIVQDLASEFRRLSTTSLKERDYVRPLLASLRAADFRLALVSNTEALFTNHDLNVLGLRPLFDVVVLSSSVGFAKPDPRILTYALRELKISPNHAVFIGDSLDTDIRGASAAGVRAVLLRDQAPEFELDENVVIVQPGLESIREAILKTSMATL